MLYMKTHRQDMGFQNKEHRIGMVLDMITPMVVDLDTQSLAHKIVMGVINNGY